MPLPLIDFDITDASFSRAMYRLYGLQNAARKHAHEWFAEPHPDTSRLLVQFMDDYGFEFATEHSPVLTGTLRSSHRLWPEYEGDSVSVTLGLDHVLNPVFGGYADEYGPEVNQRKPWMQDTLINIMAHLADIVDDLEDWTVALYQ